MYDDTDNDAEEPFGWWGWHWDAPVPLSIMQIIRAGSTDTALMALLWAMLSRGASVIVASEPPIAGKTTTLTALIDLMPAASKKVYLRGHYETFEFASAPDADPAHTVILANEMSDHLAIYLWGSRIYKTFELVSKGYSLGSTMHAETVDDVICILNSDPLFVPPEWIANLTLVINLYVSNTHGPSTRRFNAVNMLLPGKGDPTDGVLPGVRPLLLSRWDKSTDTFDHRFTNPEVSAQLSAWAHLSPADWSAEVEKRKAYLDGMLASGTPGVGSTREDLARFR